MFEEKFTEFVTLHSRRAPLSDNEAAVVRHSCRAVTASNTGESVTNWGLSRPAAMSAVASTPGAV